MNTVDFSWIRVTKDALSKVNNLVTNHKALYIGQPEKIKQVSNQLDTCASQLATVVNSPLFQTSPQKEELLKEVKECGHLIEDSIQKLSEIK